MENRNVIKIMRRQIDQVIIHEQVENGVAINKNLSVDMIDQQFITPIRVFQLEHKHVWTKERSTCHITPQVAPIISHEMQIDEA